MQFRHAIPADIPRLVVLVNSAYRGENSRQGWTTEADLLDGQRTDAQELAALIQAENSIVLLALLAEEVIGTVHLQREAETAMLGMLVIQPGLQGKGLGKIFMQAAEATAIKMWDVKRLGMYVITLRSELIRFYEKQGYRKTGVYRSFPQDVRFGIPRVQGLQLELMLKEVSQ